MQIFCNNENCDFNSKAEGTCTRASIHIETSGVCESASYMKINKDRNIDKDELQYIVNEILSNGVDRHDFVVSKQVYTAIRSTTNRQIRGKLALSKQTSKVYIIENEEKFSLFNIEDDTISLEEVVCNM